jgi:AcrR family transcriptional regulator
LAEQLGVSRGAPYRHYPERDQLLAELAEVGFNRLNEFAQQTAAKARDPVASLVERHNSSCNSSTSIRSCFGSCMSPGYYSESGISQPRASAERRL